MGDKAHLKVPLKAGAHASWKPALRRIPSARSGLQRKRGCTNTGLRRVHVACEGAFSAARPPIMKFSASVMNLSGAVEKADCDRHSSLELSKLGKSARIFQIGQNAVHHLHES